MKPRRAAIRLSCCRSSSPRLQRRRTRKSPSGLVFATDWLAQAEHGGFYQAWPKASTASTARRHDPDGRPAGERPAASRGRTARRRDGRRAAGALRRRAERSGHRDRRDVPEEPDGDHRAPGRRRSSRSSKASRSRSAPPRNTTFWPWLKQRYGFTDAQKRPYAFSVQPFLADRKLSQQGFATSEPFSIEKGGVKPVVFLLADLGYPPYSEVLAVQRDTLARRSDALARFVRASAEGWKSYLANPAPGNALIKRDNPQMSDELLAYGERKMRTSMRSSPAATQRPAGLLTMTDARWRQTLDFLRERGTREAGRRLRESLDASIVATCGSSLNTTVPRATTTRAPVVAVAGAAKTYPNGTRALAPVALDGPARRVRHAARTFGLRQDHAPAPDRGADPAHAGRSAGGAATSRRPAARAGVSRFVFQSPTLMPWARVDANVRLPLDLAHVARETHARCRRAALELVGLADVRAAFPARALRRHADARVDRARARHEPDLLLMDEPFGALDEFTRAAPRRRARGAVGGARAHRRVRHAQHPRGGVPVDARAVMGPRPGRVIADVAIDEPYPRERRVPRVGTLRAHCERLSALVAVAGGDARRTPSRVERIAACDDRRRPRPRARCASRRRLCRRGAGRAVAGARRRLRRAAVHRALARCGRRQTLVADRALLADRFGVTLGIALTALAIATRRRRR